MSEDQIPSQGMTYARDPDRQNEDFSEQIIVIPKSVRRIQQVNSPKTTAKIQHSQIAAEGWESAFLHNGGIYRSPALEREKPPGCRNFPFRITIRFLGRRF
ncbi:MULTISPECIES: hypothetical protein [unclassified Methanoregula]|uniref:hypothetical protein n=1 Tax=unclassified Methanoregula TaxID=2649730 RepID=UPI0025D1341A|nr:MULTISPECIES: hypothetical protein [unclassified Methanoregula]